MKRRAKPEPIAIVGWLSLSLRHGQCSRFLDVLRSGSDAIVEVPQRSLGQQPVLRSGPGVARERCTFERQDFCASTSTSSSDDAKRTQEPLARVAGIDIPEI
jgi:hypothetical protein